MYERQMAPRNAEAKHHLHIGFAVFSELVKLQWDDLPSGVIECVNSMIL